MFSQKCHFIFPRFSCGEFCKLCNFRFCGFVVTKAWKLHFYLCCDAEASSSILQNPVLQTMQKNGLSSRYSSLCEKIGEIVLWIKQQWCCAYYVMRCLVVFGYRCAPPQRLVLLSLLRSRVRARRCSVCRRLARTGGKLERRRPTTESGFFKKLQENLILVPTVNFKAVKLVVHWTRFISSLITKAGKLAVFTKW